MKHTHTHLKSFAKLVMLVGLGFTTMANEGCKEEQPAPAPERQLRKLAELGFVNAGNFDLPGGGSFDFQFVAAAQMSNLLADSKEFTLLYSNNSPGFSGGFGISSVDADLYDYWSGGESFSTAELSQEAQCLLDRPQVKIDANVLSFQVTNGGGLSVGFGPGGSFDPSFLDSVSFNAQRAQLNVNVFGRDPLSRVVLGSAQGVAHQKKYDFGLVINFGMFRLGPKYFFESPLAEVTEAGLTTAVSTLAKNMSHDPWHTRLIRDLDTHIVIQAGANAGLKVGDVVAVYNETHDWDGRPCMSELKGSFKEPAAPILKAEIISVGNAISQARVDRSSQTIHRPQVGARVELFSFAQDAL